MLMTRTSVIVDYFNLYAESLSNSVAFRNYPLVCDQIAVGVLAAYLDANPTHRIVIGTHDAFQMTRYTEYAFRLRRDALIMTMNFSLAASPLDVAPFNDEVSLFDGVAEVHNFLTTPTAYIKAFPHRRDPAALHIVGYYEQFEKRKS